MNLLVTAGNTLVPIDKVRCLTNVFTGRTGAGIALAAQSRGYQVTLLTSHPEVLPELQAALAKPKGTLTVHRYRTFQDLEELMERNLQPQGPDAVIHASAVSDYQAAGIYAPNPQTRFLAEDDQWTSSDGQPPTLEDRSADKVKSNEPELWLRLVRTPKLVDFIRSRWEFKGVLVKFKLEVNVSEEQLREIGEASRAHSQADLMVANTLEGSGDWALLGPVDGWYDRVRRAELASRLLDQVERLVRSKAHA